MKLLNILSSLALFSLVNGRILKSKGKSKGSMKNSTNTTDTTIVCTCEDPTLEVQCEPL